MLNMTKIKSIKAREILNSKGNWTVEAEVETEQGVFKASVPSGASKGKYEAKEVGPEKAVENIEKIIGPELRGKEIKNKKIDQLLINLDGTENKSKLGANAILGISMACCRAGAKAKNISLHQHIAKIFNWDSPRAGTVPVNLPGPCFNILNGGVHAGNDLDIQEFMIIPEMESFKENLKVGAEIYHSLKKILEKKFGKQATNLGDEGGFAPPLKKTTEALDLIMEAIKKAGYANKVKIGLDCAASEFYRDEKYNFEDKKLTGDELSKFYQNLTKKYPILFLEDPFSQDDWQSWKLLNLAKQQPGDRAVTVVGDDLTVTNAKRIREAKEKEACSAIVLKPNQIGTVSETIEAAKLAKKFGWKIIVSHRSGDTCDDFIADLACGIGADFIKAGAPARGERVAKYNRLLRIEEETINK